MTSGDSALLVEGLMVTHDLQRQAGEADAAIDAAEAELLADARSRNGRRSRTKGKVWERAVAALLRPIFGDQAKRGFQSRSGRDGCDVEGTPYWVECKHGQFVNLRAALKQALEASDGRPVVVAAKDDRSAPLAVMRLSDWLELVHAAHAAGVTQGLRDAAQKGSP